MCLAYMKDELPSNPNWQPPEKLEWSPELLKELEKEFGRRKCWPKCKEEKEWLENQFDIHFKNPDYKPQYFDLQEFDKIRKRRHLI